MRPYSKKMLLSLQLVTAALLGLYSWYNFCGTYWQKDLQLPVDGGLLLIVLVGVSAAVVAFLSLLFSQILPKHQLELFSLSTLTMAVGVPAVNVAEPLVFTTLGGESSIYFMMESGGWILAGDSIFLLIVGSILGLAIAGMTVVLSRAVMRSWLA